MPVWVLWSPLEKDSKQKHRYFICTVCAYFLDEITYSVQYGLYAFQYTIYISFEKLNQQPKMVLNEPQAQDVGGCLQCNGMNLERVRESEGKVKGERKSVVCGEAV